MKKQRLLIFLILIVIVPIGFYTKFYTGPARYWVSNSMGGLIYEIFWCLVIALIFPSVRSGKIALLVFFVTSSLEFLQLWNSPFLESIRSNFIGRTVLGNSFNWMDFPYSAVGCLLGWYLLSVIKKVSPVSQHTSDLQ